MKSKKCSHGCCCEEISEINKKSLKPLKVRFCPSCNSTNVGFVFRLQNIFGLLPRVECYECGHFGNEFPLIVTTKGELEKREKNKGKVKSKKRSRKK